MLPQKQAEEAMVSSSNLTQHDDRDEEMPNESGLGLKSLLWHGGSVYDAWFSCASNQVIQKKKKKKKTQIIIWIRNTIFL